MKCSEAKPLFSTYMDLSMGGKQMRLVSAHLQECEACRSEYTFLCRTQQLVAGLGRKQPPQDLALKLRVMASQQLAQRRRQPFEGLRMRLENAFNAFMVPATAGMLSAVIIFGLLIGVMSPGQLISGSNDVPILVYTPRSLHLLRSGK
jgi:predicted anti-sigma-YlaC factor YlaD